MTTKLEELKAVYAAYKDADVAYAKVAAEADTRALAVRVARVAYEAAADAYLAEIENTGGEL
jgi:hypothetical protein